MNEYDEDLIFAVRSSNQSELIFIAFSSVSQFNVRFPSGVHRVIVSIRDRYDCITEWNLTQIVVQIDPRMANDSINPFLLMGNQNEVGQMVISWSQQLNFETEQSVRQAISSK